MLEKQNNFKYLRELIGRECIDFGQFNDEQIELLGAFLTMTEDSYILVQWFDVQELMEEEWFDKEAIFCAGSEEKTGDRAYFIPLKRIF